MGTVSYRPKYSKGSGIPTLALVGFLGSKKAWRKLLEQDQRCVCTLGFTSSSGLHIKGSNASLKRLWGVGRSVTPC